MKPLSFLILFIPCVVTAQEKASIYGYMQDGRTANTLLGANISIVDTQQGTSSSTRGFYRIPNITPGSYAINVTYIGYKTYRKEIKLSPGQNLRLDIKERT